MRKRNNRRAIGLRGRNLISTLASLTAALTFCASAQSSTLDKLLPLITGDFDNRAQFEAQEGDTISRLGLQRRRVNAPALGTHVVYAQINHRADPSDIYRQTIMVFEEADDGAVSSRTLRFADADAHRDIMDNLERFETLTADDIGPALPGGCDPSWSFDGEQFISRISADECVIISRRTGNPRHIQGTEFVRIDAILNEESGYREDGSMIFGLPEGVYYRYDRVSAAPATDGGPSCDKPVFMVVSGTTLDGKRMGAYGAKIAETGIYAEVGGYYLNAPRPVEVFEGDIDPRHATLMVRFPCIEHARTFWYSELYQETIKPLRLDPSAGDYTVTVYEEANLPEHMRDKVGNNAYRARFMPDLPQVR